MKTTTNSQNRPGRNLLKITKGLLPSLAAGTLVSCSTHAVGTATTSPPAVDSGPRVMVQHHVQTSLPKAEPADYPRAGWDERRVTFGDDEGSRSMIPIDLFKVSW